jgi:hypothetical protein
MPEGVALQHHLTWPICQLYLSTAASRPKIYLWASNWQAIPSLKKRCSG